MRWLIRLLGIIDEPVKSQDIENSFHDVSCTCGCHWFTPGGPATRVEINGVRSRLPLDGTVLSCLSCAKRWYVTPAGLIEPHPDAMPPSWAGLDMQKKAFQERAKALARGEGTPSKHRDTDSRPREVPRGPGDGFRMPPKPPRRD